MKIDRLPGDLVRYSALVYQVKLYETLEPGWDGINSVPPSMETLETAIRFLGLIPLTLMMPMPMVSGSGVIGFYWDSPTSYIDVEIDKHCKLSALVIKHKHSRDDHWIPDKTLADYTPAFFTEHFSRLLEKKEDGTPLRSQMVADVP